MPACDVVLVYKDVRSIIRHREISYTCPDKPVIFEGFEAHLPNRKPASSSRLHGVAEASEWICQYESCAETDHAKQQYLGSMTTTDQQIDHHHTNGKLSSARSAYVNSS